MVRNQLLAVLGGYKQDHSTTEILLSGPVQRNECGRLLHNLKLLGCPHQGRASMHAAQERSRKSVSARTKSHHTQLVFVNHLSAKKGFVPSKKWAPKLEPTRASDHHKGGCRSQLACFP